MTFGERVRQARKRKGLTLKQLGEACHVSPQAVQAWEKTENAPSFSRLTVLANALGVDWAWLLGDEATAEQMMDSGVKPSPFEDRYQGETPVIDVKDAIFFSAYNVQTDRVPPAKGYVVPTHEVIGSTFAFEIEDDSMEPRFRVGDLVIVRAGLEVTNSDFAVGVPLNDWQKPVFRKYNFSKRRGVTLTPLNKSYSTWGLHDDPTQHGIILGIMIEHRQFRPGIKKTSWD